MKKSDLKFTKSHLRNTFTSSRDKSRIKGENIFNTKHDVLSHSKYWKRLKLDLILHGELNNSSLASKRLGQPSEK